MHLGIPISPINFAIQSREKLNTSVETPNLFSTVHEKPSTARTRSRNRTEVEIKNTEGIESVEKAKNDLHISSPQMISRLNVKNHEEIPKKTRQQPRTDRPILKKLPSIYEKPSCFQQISSPLGLKYRNQSQMSRPWTNSTENSQIMKEKYVIPVMNKYPVENAALKIIHRRNFTVGTDDLSSQFQNGDQMMTSPRIVRRKKRKIINEIKPSINHKEEIHKIYNQANTQLLSLNLASLKSQILSPKVSSLNIKGNVTSRPNDFQRETKIFLAKPKKRKEKSISALNKVYKSIHSP